MPLQKKPFDKKGTCANPLCGREFIRKRRGQQYCCLSCASKHNKMKETGKPRKEYKPKFCGYCDKWFVPLTPGQKFCCADCRKQAERLSAIKREMRRRKSGSNPRKKLSHAKSSESYLEEFKKPAPTMKQVLDYMYKHNCQYRRAIQEMEAGNQ